MELILSVFVFFFGLITGSFINSVIYRLESKKSIIFDRRLNNFSQKKFSRSLCPKCGHELNWYELIPLFSFIVQKGKCRSCHKRISWQYPLVELAAGLIFLFIFNRYNFSFNFYSFLIICLSWIISVFFIIIFVYDFKYYLIPDKIIYPSIISGIFWVLVNKELNWQSSLFSAAGATIFFLLLVIISRGRWMGMGDVKLVFFLGLILGWPKILASLLLAFWSGALVSIILILTKKKTIKSQIPFGPFLVFSAFLFLFFDLTFLQDLIYFVKIVLGYSF